MRDPGELAVKLQKARKVKGMTYQQLALSTDLSIATIESIFQGKQKNPTLTTLQRICDILELSIDKLINRKDFLLFKQGNKTIFSHDKHAKDIVVDIKLLAKMEDPDNILTTALLEANNDTKYKLEIPYDSLKILLIKGTLSVNGKKAPLMGMVEIKKKEIKKGVLLSAKKGSRAIFCFIPGVHIRI